MAPSRQNGNPFDHESGSTRRASNSADATFILLLVAALLREQTDPLVTASERRVPAARRLQRLVRRPLSSVEAANHDEVALRVCADHEHVVSHF
jgi:hypothetical protein